MNDARSALVLFSGGQDSTTCLAWALERFAHVETVAFDYRQRHRIELDQRLVVLDEIRRRFGAWADRLGEDHLVDLGEDHKSLIQLDSVPLAVVESDRLDMRKSL